VITGEKTPILVTGAHRSGTTWVGRLLASAPQVSYLSEPLNVLHRPGVFNARVPFWYTYVCDVNGDEYLPSYQDLLSHKYHFGAELASLRSFRDLFRMGRDAAIFARGRIGRRTPLLKDPFAIFSLVWFAETLHCRIVAIVRHPAAFASGLKRLGWSFDFADLLGQPLLMRDHLEPYRVSMQSASAADVVDQAGVLWAAIYGTLQRLRAVVPAIQIIRHEDLAADPIPGFRKLYDNLGLEYTRTANQAILDSSRPDNPSELSRGRVHSVKMDSRGSLQNWKRRLSGEEVTRVRELTDGVWQAYYRVESWE
jgi:hypothetical protein